MRLPGDQHRLPGRLGRDARRRRLRTAGSGRRCGSLAAAIGAVLDAPPDRERLRRRAAAFDVDASVERYLACLLALEGVRRARPRRHRDVSGPRAARGDRRGGISTPPSLSVGQPGRAADRRRVRSIAAQPPRPGAVRTGDRQGAQARAADRTIATRSSGDRASSCRDPGPSSCPRSQADAYRAFLRRLLGIERFALRLHWHYTPSGCSVSPHCDARRKLGSHIFYFNTEADWDPRWGGETLLLDDGGRLHRDSSPRFEDFDRIETSGMPRQPQPDLSAPRQLLARRARDPLPPRPAAQGLHRRVRAAVAGAAGAAAAVSRVSAGMRAKILLALGSVVLTLLALELVLARFFPQRTMNHVLSNRAGVYRASDVVLPELIPNFSGREREHEGEFDVAVHINSLGYRQAEFDPAKADQLRIVAIGDSFTFGDGVEERGRVAARPRARAGGAEHAARRGDQCRRGGPLDRRVLPGAEAAQPGARPRRGHRRLLRRQRHRRQDAATHIWSEVDERGRPLKIDRPTERIESGYRVMRVLKPRWRLPVVRNSHVAQLVYDGGKALVQLWYPPPLDEEMMYAAEYTPETQRAVARVEDLFAAMAELCRAHGATLLVVMIPTREQVARSSRGRPAASTGRSRSASSPSSSPGPGSRSSTCCRCCAGRWPGAPVLSIRRPLDRARPRRDGAGDRGVPGRRRVRPRRPRSSRSGRAMRGELSPARAARSRAPARRAGRPVPGLRRRQRRRVSSTTRPTTAATPGRSPPRSLFLLLAAALYAPAPGCAPSPAMSGSSCIAQAAGDAAACGRSTTSTLQPNLVEVIDVQGDGMPGIEGVQRITTDALGYRVNRPIDYERPAGLRVFAIGGSTTEDIHLDDHRTWTRCSARPPRGGARAPGRDDQHRPVGPALAEPLCHARAR